MILSWVMKLSRNSPGRKSHGTEYAVVFNGSQSLGDHEHWKWYCQLTGSWGGQLAEHSSWRPYSPSRAVGSLTWSQWENFKFFFFFCNEEATWYFGRQLPAVWRRGKPEGACFIDKGWKDREEEQISESCKCESQPNLAANSFAWKSEDDTREYPGEEWGHSPRKGGRKKVIWKISSEGGSVAKTTCLLKKELIKWVHLHSLLVGMENSRTAWKIVWRFLTKLNMLLRMCFSSFGVYPNEMRT